MKGSVKFTNSELLKYFLKGSVGLFVAVIVASLATTLLSAVVPQIIAFTIDSVIGSEPVSGSYAFAVDMLGGIERIRADIWIVAVIVVAIAVIMLVTRYVMMYCNARGNQVLIRRMRDTMFSHIQKLPLSFLNAHNTGDIIQRCTSDIFAISNFISNQLVSLFRIAALLLLSLVFMFVTDVKLAAIASAFIPLLIGSSLLFHVKARKHFKKCDEQEGVLSTYAQENLTGARVVRAFGKERYERDKFEKQNNYYTGLWVSLEKYMAAFWTGSDLLAALQSLAIIAVGTVFCVNGTLTAGNLVAFISYNTMMIGPVRQLGRIISNMSKAGVALGRIGEIMNADEEEYGEADVPVSGDIEFKNVTFGYEKDKPVLNGVSFTVKQGATLGILGGTGSGKSTVAALIDGLYKVDGGEITIGGRNVSDIPPASLRRSVGFVMQESYIYSRSIAENIGIAADGAQRSDIEHAASVACLSDNINGFAGGYDTVVGERGVTLSGGQKQRVAIARTMIRNTPYIIFDDSLSAVDSETDAAIRANLKDEFGNATVIIISHRITTVMHADNILVLDGGRVAEFGTNAELLANDGIYKRIYDIQMSLPPELEAELAAKEGGGE